MKLCRTLTLAALSMLTALPAAAAENPFFAMQCYQRNSRSIVAILNGTEWHRQETDGKVYVNIWTDYGEADPIAPLTEAFGKPAQAILGIKAKIPESCMAPAPGVRLHCQIEATDEAPISVRGARTRVGEDIVHLLDVDRVLIEADENQVRITIDDRRISLPVTATLALPCHRQY